MLDESLPIANDITRVSEQRLPTSRSKCFRVRQAPRHVRDLLTPLFGAFFYALAQSPRAELPVRPPQLS
jgi:hypothetical protein